MSSARLSRSLFVGLVFLLPLHTVYLTAWVSWKPWMVLLVALVVMDVIAERRWPYPGGLTLGVGAFLLALAVSFPSDPSPAFARLWLAAALGGLLLLVVARHARGRLDLVLRTVFWWGAALATTGVAVALVSNGALGAPAVEAINDLPLVEHVNKTAYLGEGFVAVTNWHVEPGYASTWATGWMMLAMLASARGAGSGRRWVDALVVGGLAVVAGLSYSRTGLGLIGLAGVTALVVAWRDDRFDLGAAVRVAAGGVVAGLAILAMVLIADRPGVGGDVTVALSFRMETLSDVGAIDRGEPGLVPPDLVVPDNRLDVWSEYLRRFSDSPLRGIGLGTGWAEEGLQEPHNLGIQVLAESGLIGLLGLGALVLSLGRGGGWLAGGLVVVTLAAGLTHTMLFEPLPWFAAGLWAAERASVKTVAPPADVRVW